MFFKYDNRKPLMTKYHHINCGDMFRYNENVYIKLNQNLVLNIWSDAVGPLIIDSNEDVEFLDYEIIIYAEE